MSRKKLATAKKRRRLWRKIAALALTVILLPFILLLIYRLPFIHPVSTLMVRDTITLHDYKRQWMPIEDISPTLTNAVLVSEDGRFCAHGGIDWQALKTVVNSESGPQRGASTIPMQTVKNLFLWHDRSYVRKGVEIPLAYAADTILPKKRIMEIYLNIAEWGDGIYGAEAAAQYYFHTSARNLTQWQGALLAAALPNPQQRNPAYPSIKLQQLATIIATRARRSGAYITCLQ